MKKIEASLIKRILRMSSQNFVSSVLELSLYYLPLSYTLGHLEFSWSTLGECGILGVLEQEGKGRAGKHNRTLGLATTMGFACRY